MTQVVLHFTGSNIKLSSDMNPKITSGTHFQVIKRKMVIFSDAIPSDYLLACKELVFSENLHKNPLQICHTIFIRWIPDKPTWISS